MKYGMNLVFMNEFRVTSESCSESPDALRHCSDLLSSNSIDTNIYYVYIIVLIVLFAGFRIAAGFVLVQKANAVV